MPSAIKTTLNAVPYIEMPAVWNTHRTLSIIVVIFGALMLLALIQYAFVHFNGSPVAAPVIPRTTQKLGDGPALRYVILGDSTAVGQGGAYNRSYATASANHLAMNHLVSWVNVAVSGARARDILEQQLPKALGYNPDVVLVVVGANDVTHVTSTASVQQSLRTTISKLRTQNSNLKIILTGAPDMGSVPRLPQPLRALAGLRTRQLNAMITQLTKSDNVVFAPIAHETGPTFRKHPELFAADKFHPNDEGYELWKPVINNALDEALSS